MPALQLHVDLRPCIAYGIPHRNEPVVSDRHPNGDENNDDKEYQRGHHQNLHLSLLSFAFRIKVARAQPFAVKIGEEAGDGTLLTFLERYDESFHLAAVEPESAPPPDSGRFRRPCRFPY